MGTCTSTDSGKTIKATGLKPKQAVIRDVGTTIVT